MERELEKRFNKILDLIQNGYSSNLELLEEAMVLSDKLLRIYNAKLTLTKNINH